MTLPMSFDDVPYSNEFRGDLIIAHGVIYYFAHTSVALERKKRGYGATDHLGLIALPFELLGLLLQELRTTINQPRLRSAGLWKDGDTSKFLQERLDPIVTEKNKETRPMFQFDSSKPDQYSYELPKPMRFPLADIVKISLRRGLIVWTEYDDHRFSIGFHRKKLLREALWEGGFAHLAD